MVASPAKNSWQATSRLVFCKQRQGNSRMSLAQIPREHLNTPISSSLSPPSNKSFQQPFHYFTHHPTNTQHLFTMSSGGKGKASSETKSSSRSSKAGLQCESLVGLPCLDHALTGVFSPRRSYPPSFEEGQLCPANRFRCSRLPRCRP